MRELDNSVRGLLRAFGLRPPRLLRGRWGSAVRQLIAPHPTLMAALDPILVARDQLGEELARLDRLVRNQAREDAVCRRLMTVPGVGAIVALSYVAAIDEPTRFATSKAVGPALGLTPSRYQSGETDRSGAITKAGDMRTRVALFEAAHVMMTRVVRWNPLKAWAMRVAARRGAKRAKVALARKLAVLRHRLWIDGTKFQARPA
jgi:transposase